jgi:hypothetical protein
LNIYRVKNYSQLTEQNLQGWGQDQGLAKASLEVISKALSQGRGDRRVREERYTREPLTQDQGV